MRELRLGPSGHPWDRRKISKRQREVYDFIVKYIAENGRAPRYSDIGTHLGISAVAIFRTVWILYDRGWVGVERFKPRSIVLPPPVLQPGEEFVKNDVVEP